MTLEVGRIYLIPASIIKPPKAKLCLCVCDEKPWFFFINTKAHFVAGHSVPLAMAESTALKRDSHLDIAGVLVFQPHDLAQRKTRDFLADAAIQRAIDALHAGVKMLPKAHGDHVIAKLSATLIPF